MRPPAPGVVLNRRNGVIHRADCEWVQRMLPWNRAECADLEHAHRIASLHTLIPRCCGACEPDAADPLGDW